MSNDKKHLRKHLFVDPKVQGALVTRVAVYWVVCLFTMTVMLLCWNMLTGPARMPWTHLDNMWFHYGPALIASLLLVPLVMIDIVRVSNRFAGPLLRLRRLMRDLAAGKPVEPIHFRNNDFWQEIAEEFNAVAARVQGSSASPTPEEEEPELVGSADAS